MTMDEVTSAEAKLDDQSDHDDLISMYEALETKIPATSSSASTSSRLTNGVYTEKGRKDHDESTTFHSH